MSIKLFFNKNKKNYFLIFFVLLTPICIIIGNFAINLICLAILGSLIANYLFGNLKLNSYKKINYYFFFLLAVLTINLLNSSTKIISLSSTIGVLRYFILFFAIIYCLENNKNFIKIFTKIILFSLFFVTFDTLFQYFTGKDMFGYEGTFSHGRRLSGPFGKELVVGSFIAKMTFLSLIYLILDKIYKNYLFLILGLFIVTTLLSNERSVTIMLILSSCILILFFEFKKIYKLIFFTSLIITIFLIFKYDPITKDKFINQTKLHFKDSYHKAHFLTAYEIYKDNKIFGSGLHSFRVVCGNPKYESIDTKFKKQRCTTHPHNTYLEILSETGIFGLIIFLSLNLHIVIFFIWSFLKKKFNNVLCLLMSNYLLLFFPFQTTGSFFSTWNGSFYWLFLAFIFYYMRLKKFRIDSVFKIIKKAFYIYKYKFLIKHY